MTVAVFVDASWNDGLGVSFREQLMRHTGQYALDLGCSLHAGGFEIPDGHGPADTVIWPADTALVRFFLAMVRRLQRLATVPAINWSMYERTFSGQ